MAPHILDRRHGGEGRHLAAVLRLARRASRDPSRDRLFRTAPAARAATGRMRAFLRIARRPKGL